MESIRYSLYYLGKQIGQTLESRSLSEFVELLQSLELGNIEVSSSGGSPVFRIEDCPTCCDRQEVGEAMCYFQAGLIAGGIQHFWQQPVDVKEVKCQGLGNPYCEFRVLRLPAELAAFNLSQPDWTLDLNTARKMIIRTILAFQKQGLEHPQLSKGGDLKAKRIERPTDTEVIFTLEDIRGVSESITQLKKLAEKAARSDFAVLLQGESGTGKELFAHAIHHMSRRAGGPFISLNCAAIPENLLEAELFGYEGGSFTGARKGGKAGKFEMAHGGTLFLDEIGDMPLSMQAKLLRVIQYGELQKVGSTARLRVDVRLIAASNRDLTTLVGEKRFREDLFYRLNVIRLEIPPLRERPEDIPVLAHHILERLNHRYPETQKTITPEAIEKLKTYVWPGNVRELENIIERLFSLVDYDVITENDLQTFLPVSWSTRNGWANKPLKNSLLEIERELILEALEAAGGNRTQAAKILGLPRSTFYEKLKQYNII